MPENNLILLSKCVEREFAETLFYDGVLHFDYPSKCIEKGEKGNVGQWDALEGVYTNENKFWNFFRRWFPRLVRDKETGTKYLRSRKIVNWPCYCLYSISDQTKPEGREGDYVVYDMSEAYAQDFSGKETWENRFETKFPDRKAMVVIHRPQVFLDKVKRRFADFRLVEGRDYYMGCVQYRKEGEKFTYKDVPWELFHKDARFEKQQEYRIALNPSSGKVKEMLIGGQDVALGGSLEDCAMLKSHFYKGARILVKDGEVRLEIRDWSNMSGPLHEMEFVPLMNLLGATYNFRMKCTLNGREAVAYELMEEIRKVMNDKYHTVWGIVDEEGHGRMMQLQSGYGIGNIERNEEKDSGFYLRNYKGYKASAFEELYVWDSGEWKRYTHLTYDIEGAVVPLVGKEGVKED